LSPRRVPALALACLAVPAAILAGCGGGGEGSTDVGPAAAVPANAPLYVDLTVKPQGSAKTDANSALSKILNTDDPGAKLISLVDQAGNRKPPLPSFTYQQDIAPWLGSEAGFFVTGFSGQGTGATVVEQTNTAAATSFLHKVSGTRGAQPYKGVSIETSQDGLTSYAIDKNFLIAGNDADVKAAIDAEQGDSLGDSSDFKHAIGDLPGDRLATLYTVPKTFIDALGDQFDASTKAQLEASAGDQLDQPVAGALTATADTIQIDATGGNSGVETPESSLIGDAPAQAWLALGIGNLGDNIKQTIEQVKDQIPNFDATVQQIEQTTGSSLDQLEGSLGDAVLYVEGTTEPTLTGALVIQSKDPGLTERLLTQLQGLLQLGSGGVRPLQLSGGGTGFQINDPTVAPRPVELAEQGDKLVIGYGAGSAEQSLAPAQTLSSSPNYSAAHDQISALGTDLFLDFPSVFALAESTGAKSDPGYAQAKPYLDALTFLVTGSGSNDDKAEFKAVLGLK
jgi:hypothetical protein